MLSGIMDYRPDLIFFAVFCLVMIFYAGKLLLTREASKIRGAYEEKERLAFAVDAASDGVVITDPNQKDNPVIYANETFYKMTGYSPEEVIGKNCRFLQGPKTNPATVQQIRDAISQKQSIKISILNYRKDGVSFWNGLRISPVFSRSGKLQYFLGFQADINERMRQEQRLIEERDYTSSIIQGTPVIVCGIAADGRSNFMNPAGEKATGYKSEELLGKNWWRTFYPGEEYSQVEQLFTDFEKGNVREREMTLTAKNGDKKVVLWNFLNRIDENGKFIEIIAFGNDVTERMRIEEELRKNEEAFRYMLLSAPVMVWMADANMKFVYVNRFWLDFTGRKAKDELEDRWMELVHQDDKAAVLSAYQDAYRDKSDLKIEFRMKQRTGEYRWVTTSGMARYKDENIFAGYIGSCLDIHETKKLELQLQQSQKMETVGTLAGGIAHDLNNQLTPLTGYIDLVLKETPQGDFRRELLMEAEQAARRSAEVVQRLMNISRTSNQKKMWIRLDGLLAETKRLFPKLLASTIQTEVVCDGTIWPIHANDTELQTVLMNVAVNARDAMPNGGKLSIQACNMELDAKKVRHGFKPGHYVLISVTDTGKGVPPEMIHKIFEPFFTTKPKGQGTGLGLSMVFRIIKDHGGWVDVISEVDKGTAMQIYLPADPSAKTQSIGVSGVDKTIPGGSETILFADDEESLRNMGRVFLERLGYQVIVAQDGQEAVDLYKDNFKTIQAIILDMTMPRLTGRQTLKRILQINPEAKVILASGFTSEGTAKELMQEGASDFLPKPYTIFPLAQMLRKVIEKNNKPV